MAKVAAESGSTANRYQILAKLAAGGMAEIFLARGASVAGVERYCVLKRILRERANDAQFVQMFVDEARLAAQLHHPNIASVYDIGVLGDSYFFTMEYVHGETVRSLLERAHELGRSVPLACVLTIIAGAASGLHHAHERTSKDGRSLGIVHRDVSPSNLMVSFEGNVKLVDFGVAKADDRAVETRSGTVKGKISYLSPEQCRGERVDRRSDLFSLGIVMWELLTGRRLYRRDSDFANMTAIVNEPPPRPSLHRAEVPRAVDDIVLRLLAKSVTDRYQTADQVVEAVENASMRAGTILSTSAVGRLVRDMFGVRAEPWLELEGETTTYESMAVSSRLLPMEVSTLSHDQVEHDLSVIDLSASSMVLEAEDLSELSQSLSAASTAERMPRPPDPAPGPPAASPLITTPGNPPGTTPGTTPAIPVARPRTGSPTAPPPEAATPAAALGASAAPAPSGPPATPPKTRPTTELPRPGTAGPYPTAEPAAANVWDTTLRDPAPPGPWSTLRDAAPPTGPSATLLDVGPPTGPNATLLDAGSPSGPLATLLDAAPPGPSATLMGVSAPPVSGTGPASVVFATPNRLYAQSPAPAYGSATSGRSPAIVDYQTPPSGPNSMPGSAPNPVQNLPGPGVWNPPRPHPHAPNPPAARSPWPLVAVIITAAAIGVVAVWLVMRTTSDRALETAPVAHPPAAEPSPGVSRPSAGAPQAAPPAASPPDAGGSPDGAAREIDFSPEGTATPSASPPPAEAAPGHAGAPAIAPPTQAPGAPPRHHQTSADASAPRTASSPGPSFDELHARYEASDYAGVVRACSAATMTTALANICTLAACHTHDSAKAQRWLASNPPAGRDKLVAYCKQIGTPLKGSSAAGAHTLDL